MTFQNSVVGGVSLVRPAIQSPNFVAGSTGWQVNVDGSAEFNDVIIRGGTTVSGTSLYYNGTPALGNLILSISAAASTDTYGNAYPQGLGVFGSDGELTADGSTLTVEGTNGSQVQLSTGGVGQADIIFTPRDLVGTTWFNGYVGTVLGAGNRPGIEITSPSADVPGSTGSGVGFYGAGPGAATDTYILFAADRVNFNDLVEIGGNLDVTGTVDIAPAVGAASLAIAFNGSYNIYSDNAGAGAANSRLWIDTPDTGEVVIGPRSGAAFITSLRLRTNATTASAANCFIDSGTQKISRSTSSLKYKQDVEDLTLDLDAVRALRPVRFHDKNEMQADPENARWYVGLIAEEVDALGLTEFVSYMDGEPDALMYDRFCAALLVLLKDAEERITALENA